MIAWSAEISLVTKVTRQLDSLVERMYGSLHRTCEGERYIRSTSTHKSVNLLA
ncbi:MULTISPECIES: hypothetical protein [unclassified Paenibacillus]|uniref:hypothetical protein n=1 Tax=unclassified Paenibacillus TaxID=185978 RepID=UPI00363A1B33